MKSYHRTIGLMLAIIGGVVLTGCNKSSEETPAPEAGPAAAAPATNPAATPDHPEKVFAGPGMKSNAPPGAGQTQAAPPGPKQGK